MLENIQQTTAPVTANGSQSVIAALPRPDPEQQASATGQSSQIPEPQAADPEPQAADHGPRAADPGPQAADPGPHSEGPGQSATEQQTYIPGQSALGPLPKKHYDLGECVSKISKTLDSFQKKFQDPVWTGLMGIHAAMQPLSASTQLQVIADINQLVRGYYDP